MDVGDEVADFELKDETGQSRRLSELLASGPIVLFFYPAAMTYGCTKESCHFRDLQKEFAEVGAQPTESEEVISTALGGDWEFRGIRPPRRS